ncbi:MAG: hypothetical protein U0R19_31240 [Bryobacteraceae bacterium]
MQQPPFVMERKGRIEDMDRSFDVEYWQRQGSTAIFAAAWQMVVDAHLWKGGSESELELQRTVESVQRKRR